MKTNKLIIIENGTLFAYTLDNRLCWELGRRTHDNSPDIALYSPTVSRKHGRFRNMDGVWFYLDNNSKNGTVYNKARVKPGFGNRTRPLLLHDGDTFVFGGGEEREITPVSAFGLFLTGEFGTEWRAADTQGCPSLLFRSGSETAQYKNPPCGLVVRKENGIAVYMGRVTYLTGDMEVSEV